MNSLFAEKLTTLAIPRPRGRDRRAALRIVPAPHPDVRTIRSALGMSQEEFALAFCIPLATLKGWEQGRRRPDATAAAYLCAIAACPDSIRQALLREVRP